jgi:hypothetical protein
MIENITTFTDELDGKEFVVIHREDGSFTSMPKSVYDEQLAANEAEAK